ncbi:MAG: hypothetical protein AB7P20_13220 [Rhizobiaceae bacterium]
MTSAASDPSFRSWPDCGRLPVCADYENREDDNKCRNQMGGQAIPDVDAGDGEPVPPWMPIRGRPDDAIWQIHVPPSGFSRIKGEKSALIWLPPPAAASFASMTRLSTQVCGNFCDLDRFILNGRLIMGKMA